MTVVKKAQIEGYRFHDLRITAFTTMCRVGVAEVEVMKLFGHTQPVKFARYVNTNEETAIRIADALNSLWKITPIKYPEKRRR